MEELNVKKTKYFVIAIIILIILGVLLIVHFNNKEMVNGEDKGKSDTTTTKTTEKVTTTKRRVKVEEVSDEVIEETVYKSVIDEENKLVYNYKLTDEITESDKLISKKLEISDAFKEQNVIGLYDISLYDVNNAKKTVINSLITIKIPLIDELKGYDEYKVVYINDNNKITDETFEVKVDGEYIEFNTTHLSVFGIIATKKEVVEEKVVDLTNVKVDVKINDVVLEDTTNILLDSDDKMDLVVGNIDENIDYEVYYGLKALNAEEFEYKLYEDKIELEKSNKYRLFVKISSGENFKTFEIGNIGLYDEVYVYDQNEELTKNVVIGSFEDKPEYEFDSVLDNKNIVIDFVEKVEEQDNNEITTNENDNTNNINNETINTSATISVNGNIYLVEKTDISELQMTGYLFIDTNENILFGKTDTNQLSTSSLYSIIIRSKEFTLNGDKYTYEYDLNGNLVIKKVVVLEDNTETKTEVKVEDFDSIFNGMHINQENKENLVFDKNNVVPTPGEGINESTTEPIENPSNESINSSNC